MSDPSFVKKANSIGTVYDPATEWSIGGGDVLAFPVESSAASFVRRQLKFGWLAAATEDEYNTVHPTVDEFPIVEGNVFLGRADQWAGAGSTVIPAGKIAVESDTGKAKFGNGVDTFDDLNYTGASEDGGGSTGDPQLDASFFGTWVDADTVSVDPGDGAQEVDTDSLPSGIKVLMIESFDEGHPAGIYTGAMGEDEVPIEWTYDEDQASENGDLAAVVPVSGSADPSLWAYKDGVFVQTTAQAQEDDDTPVTPTFANLKSAAGSPTQAVMTGSEPTATDFTENNVSFTIETDSAGGPYGIVLDDRHTTAQAVVDAINNAAPGSTSLDGEGKLVIVGGIGSSAFVTIADYDGPGIVTGLGDGTVNGTDGDPATYFFGDDEDPGLTPTYQDLFEFISNML